jgi:hypothetical protein
MEISLNQDRPSYDLRLGLNEPKGYPVFKFGPLVLVWMARARLLLQFAWPRHCMGGAMPSGLGELKRQLR